MKAGKKLRSSVDTTAAKVYVALSRIQSLEGLHIRGGNNTADVVLAGEDAGNVWWIWLSCVHFILNLIFINIVVFFGQACEGIFFILVIFFM